MLRSVGNDGDDTLELPPVVVNETRIQSRSDANRIGWATFLILSVMWTTCMTIIALAALIGPVS